MPAFLRAPAFAVSWLLVIVAHLSAPLGAAAQQPTSDLPVSLERIREALEKDPAPRLKLEVPQPPQAIFRTRVDQQVWVPSLEEYLRKEFELSVFERQSAEWRSKCCGINLDQLFSNIKKAWQRRELRKIREQIARELAQLEAARTQQEAITKK